MPHFSPYPTAKPVNKHDLLCPSQIVDALRSSSAGSSAAVNALETIESLSSSMVRSATSPTSPPDLIKVAPFYTYPDAPVAPKPLSRSPRVWGLARRRLFDLAADEGGANGSDGNSGSGTILKRCTIAAKLPSRCGDGKAQRYSRSFRDFVKFLGREQLAAVLACDSKDRIGFVIPAMAPDDGVEGSDDWDDANAKGGDECYHAHLYYAPLEQFIPWAKENYATNLKKSTEKMSQKQSSLQQHDAEINEMANCTLQFTPLPKHECEPSSWQDQHDGSNDVTLIKEEEEEEPYQEIRTPPYTSIPKEECEPREYFASPVAFSNADAGGGTDGLCVPPGAPTKNAASPRRALAMVKEKDVYDDDTDCEAGGWYEHEELNGEFDGNDRKRMKTTEENDDGTAGLFVPLGISSNEHAGGSKNVFFPPPGALPKNDTSPPKAMAKVKEEDVSDGDMVWKPRGLVDHEDLNGDFDGHDRKRMNTADENGDGTTAGLFVPLGIPSNHDTGGDTGGLFVPLGASPNNDMSPTMAKVKEEYVSDDDTVFEPRVWADREELNDKFDGYDRKQIKLVDENDDGTTAGLSVLPGTSSNDDAGGGTDGPFMPPGASSNNGAVGGTLSLGADGIQRRELGRSIICASSQRKQTVDVMTVGAAVVASTATTAEKISIFQQKLAEIYSNVKQKNDGHEATGILSTARECLSSLKDLDDALITDEILQSTRVGNTVAKFRKINRREDEDDTTATRLLKQELTDVSTQIIEKWANRHEFNKLREELEVIHDEWKKEESSRGANKSPNDHGGHDDDHCRKKLSKDANDKLKSLARIQVTLKLLKEKSRTGRKIGATVSKFRNREETKAAAGALVDDWSRIAGIFAGPVKQTKTSQKTGLAFCKFQNHEEIKAEAYALGDECGRVARTCTGPAKRTLDAFRKLEAKYKQEGKFKPDMIAFKDLRGKYLPSRRRYGNLEGVPIGLRLGGRGEAAILGIHEKILAGIDSVKDQACYAVCENGKYDDEDIGSEIIYTGSGGQKGGRQVEDQVENIDNQSLIISQSTGYPIRVLRRVTKKNLDYCYVGLYQCTGYTYEPSSDGPKVYKFCLKPIAGQSQLLLSWSLMKRQQGEGGTIRGRARDRISGRIKKKNATMGSKNNKTI